MTNFGDFVSIYRRKKSLTQADLASLITPKLGYVVSDKKISRIETGATDPTPEEMKALAEVLNFSVDEALQVQFSAKSAQRGFSQRKISWILAQNETLDAESLLIFLKSCVGNPRV